MASGGVMLGYFTETMVLLLNSTTMTTTMQNERMAKDTMTWAQ
jgi:hypothetical protein